MDESEDMSKTRKGKRINETRYNISPVKILLGEVDVLRHKTQTKQKWRQQNP